jgi:hypothetical protein
MKPQDRPASSAEHSTSESPQRKLYEKPELQVYGDLADITKGAMGTNNNDGSGHPNKHFTS